MIRGHSVLPTPEDSKPLGPGHLVATQVERHHLAGAVASQDENQIDACCRITDEVRKSCVRIARHASRNERPREAGIGHPVGHLRAACAQEQARPDRQACQEHDHPTIHQARRLSKWPRANARGRRLVRRQQAPVPPSLQRGGLILWAPRAQGVPTARAVTRGHAQRQCECGCSWPRAHSALILTCRWRIRRNAQAKPIYLLSGRDVSRSHLYLLRNVIVTAFVLQESLRPLRRPCTHPRPELLGDDRTRRASSWRMRRRALRGPPGCRCDLQGSDGLAGRDPKPERAQVPARALPLCRLLRAPRGTDHVRLDLELDRREHRPTHPQPPENPICPLGHQELPRAHLVVRQ